MTTATKAINDLFSVDETTERAQAVAGRVQEASRKVTLSYLDSYERAVGSLADLEVKVAGATNAPVVIGLAEAHAELTRELAAAGAGAARALLVD
jgi:hypothetical protein